MKNVLGILIIMMIACGAYAAPTVTDIGDCTLEINFNGEFEPGYYIVFMTNSSGQNSYFINHEDTYDPYDYNDGTVPGINYVHLLFGPSTIELIDASEFGICDKDVPVTSESLGTVKAMYR